MRPGVLTVRNLLVGGYASDVPLSVRTALATKLLSGRASIAGVAAFTLILVGMVTAHRTSDLWIAAFSLIASISFFRLAVLVASAQRSRVSASTEFRFASWYIFASVAVSAGSTRALIATDDAVVHLLVVALGMGIVAIVLRNYFRPRLAILQIAILVLPPSLTMVIKVDPLYWRSVWAVSR